MYHFWGPKSWDRGTPPPSLENCPNFGPTFPVSLLRGPPGGPITLWIDEILPPHLCSVFFMTFMDSSKATMVLNNSDKKFGFGQAPPPLVEIKSHWFTDFCREIIYVAIYSLFGGALFAKIWWQGTKTFYGQNFWQKKEFRIWGVPPSPPFTDFFSAKRGLRICGVPPPPLRTKSAK